jgi:trigger factor
VSPRQEPSAPPTAAHATNPGPDANADAANLELCAALEERFQELPLARSRPVQDLAASTMKAPVLAGQVLSLPAPPPITEDEVLERFAQLADPFFQERARASGEAVELGDAVLVSWEAVVSGSGTLLAREEQVEGRVTPDPQLPGFFEGLVGKKVGAIAKFSSVMPKDFGEPDLQGRQVDFTVDIHQALERKPPDAESPEFLQALGYDSLSAVMDALGQQAMDERTQEVEHQARMRVYDLLAQGLETVLPAEWVDLEVREQWKAWQTQAQVQGEPVEEVEEWLADPGLRAEAELRLRLELALQAVCARDKVKSGPEQEAQLLEALAEAFETEVPGLKAELARTPAAEALVKKAAWFIHATEHAMSQVKIHLEEPGGQET